MKVTITIAAVVVLLLVASLTASGSEVIYDFLANASTAVWSNPVQTVAFACATGTQGQALIEDGYLEDGKSYAGYLLAQPDSMANLSHHYIRGSYSISIPANAADITFSATVGLKKGTELSHGMSFSLRMCRYGQWTTLCSTTQYYDGIFDVMSANLSGYQGETLNLYLYVDANGDPGNDVGVWRDARITNETPAIVNVRDYGAIPNDSIDDYQAVTNAITAAKGLGTSARVLFENGEYILSHQLSVSNAGHEIILEGGTDTRLTMTNRDEGVVQLRQSTNLVVKNFSVDYSPLPFFQGTVSQVQSNYIIVNVDSGYPGYSANDTFFTSGGTFGVIHDPNVPGRLKAGTANTYFVGSSISWQGPGQWRINTSERPIVVGDRVSVVNNSGWNWTFDLGNPGAQVLLDHVNVYSTPRMVCEGGSVDKVFLRNCNFCIKPGTNRIQGPNSDQIHMQNVKYGPEVLNCLFEGNLDDAINLYAIPYLVTAIASDSRFTIDTQGRMLTAGDEMVVYRPSTGVIVGRAKVVSLVGATINVDPSIPGVQMTDQFYDRTYMGGGYLVANNTFKNLRGNGVRAKTHDGMICNNQFIGLACCGLLLENIPDSEGLQVENVSVLDNTFTSCVLADSYLGNTYDAVIRVEGLATGGVRAQDKIDHDITISGNTINDWGRHAIVGVSTSAINIDGNTFTNSTNPPKATSGYMGIMYFDNCGGVSVTNNSVTDSRPPSQINGKLFVTGMAQGDISTSWNTYTVNTSAPEITLIGSWNPSNYQPNGSITGTVTDATSNMPISGVYVYLNEVGIETITDANGSYSLSNISRGLYAMSVHKPGGCYPKTVSVDISPGTVARRDVQIQSIPLAPATWNAATGFSTSSNPNRPWEFTSFTLNGTAVTFGPLFDAFSSDWAPNDWDNTPGWYESGQGYTPGIAMSNGTFYLGTVPSGHLVSSAPAAIKWTAPRDTTVTVNCAVWNPRNPTNFALAVNGQRMFPYTISGRAFANPYRYSGTFTLNAGDTIALLNGYGDVYMGLDFSIVESSFGSLSGTIRDSWDGSPVPGAQVSLDGTSFSVITNADGKYLLANVPISVNTLNVSAPGYQNSDVAVDMSYQPNCTVDVTLLPAERFTCSQIKTAMPGAKGYLGGAVTAIFSDSFYVEDLNRSSAARVNGLPSLGIVIGDVVDMLVTVAADHSLDALSISPVAHNPVGPLGVNNKNINGAVGNPGLDNMNLLVTVWGKVLDTPLTLGNGDKIFHITDGSASADGPIVTIPSADSMIILQDNFDTGKRSEWRDDAGTTHNSSPLGRLVADDPTNIAVVAAGSGSQNVNVAVDLNAAQQGGVVARYHDANNFILGVFSRPENHLCLHERVSGNWGPWLAPVSVANITGAKAHTTLRVVGNQASVTVVDELNHSVSTSTSLNTLLGTGLVGVYHDNGTATGTQHFDNFAAWINYVSHSVPKDAVQILVPASITGAIDVNSGDFVTITGIAGKGSGENGDLRKVTVRIPGDLARN